MVLYSTRKADVTESSILTQGLVIIKTILGKPLRVSNVIIVTTGLIFGKSDIILGYFTRGSNIILKIVFETKLYNA